MLGEGGTNFMDNSEPSTQNTTSGQNTLGLGFRQVRQIMSEPYTEDELEMLMWQIPIGDLPNDILQLPAEEEPTENENQLHLNYYEH